MNIVKNISLFYREGTSDKTYRVQLEDSGDGTYAVNAFFGKRGGNLKPAPQGSGLDLAAAEKAFTAVVNGRTKKGYKPDETVDAGVLDGVREPEDTGMRAQLLNAATEEQVERYIVDDAWVMEEKHDGERLLSRKDDKKILTFANRKGQRTNVPREISDELDSIEATYVIDGENVQGTYWVFDILELNGANIGIMPYSERVERRNFLLMGIPKGAVREVITYIGESEKREAYTRIKAEGGEGVVFKRLSAKHSPGRPASGGDQIKIKFWKSVSAIVGAHNTKSSIALEMIDEDGRRVNVGNVTVKADQTKPDVGEVVEIKYLWMVAKGGSLYQPEFIAVRHDIDPEECTTNQIQYKGNAA